jgi:hypothetical protein
MTDFRIAKADSEDDQVHQHDEQDGGCDCQPLVLL